MATVETDVIPKLEAVIRRSVLDTTFRAWIGTYQNITHGLLICANNNSCNTSYGFFANINDCNTRNSDEHDTNNVTFIHAFICEYTSNKSANEEKQLFDSNCWNYLTSWPSLSLESSSSHMCSMSSMTISNMSATLSYYNAVVSSVMQNSEPNTSSLKYNDTDFSHFVIQWTSSLPLYGTMTNNPGYETGNVSLTYAVQTSALYSMFESVVPTHVSLSEMMTYNYTYVPITVNTRLHSSFISEKQPPSIQASNSMSTMISETVPDELSHSVFMTIQLKPSFILTTSISLDERREMYTPFSVYSSVMASRIPPKIPASTRAPVPEGSHNTNVEQWEYISIAAVLAIAFIVIIVLVARKRRKRRSNNGLQISGLSSYLNREQSSRQSGPSDAGTGKVVMHVEAYNRAFDVLRPSYSSVYMYQEPDLGGESDDANEVLAESKTIDLDSENSCGQQFNNNSGKDEDQTEIPSRSENLIYAEVMSTRL
ncbi:hypothetical protein ACJMK2_010986 [Sinanodonta woodiana]|uniref:Uncharacterized protein n=1 Tax=Sinanodonta woodiana TaxID=1069815 RepID=A0ABD3V3I5_SINWO